MGTNIAKKLGFTLVTSKTPLAPAKPAAKPAAKAKVTIKLPAKATTRITTAPAIAPKPKAVKILMKAKPKTVTKTLVASPKKPAAPTGKKAPAVVTLKPAPAATKKLRRLALKINTDLEGAIFKNTTIFSQVLSQIPSSKTNPRRLAQGNFFP
jgi:hypothetical protein